MHNPDYYNSIESENTYQDEKIPAMMDDHLCNWNIHGTLIGAQHEFDEVSSDRLVTETDKSLEWCDSRCYNDLTCVSYAYGLNGKC